MKRAWIVRTPIADYRDIWAYNAEGAKTVVYNLTYGRIDRSSMFVEPA